MRFLSWGGWWRFAALLFALLGVLRINAQSPQDTTFLSTLGELREASYEDKATIAERLSETGHPSVRAVLTALLDGRLYYRNSDQKVFIAKMADVDPLNLIDPLTLKDAGTVAGDSMTSIGTNNGLRSTLRTTVAHFSLSSPDASVRLDAVRELAQALDDSNVALLKQRLSVETDSGVKKEISTDLALAALDGTDQQARLAAIATLESSVSQDVRNKIAGLIAKNPDGSYAEKDDAVRKAAVAAVRSIDGWRNFYSGIETLFFGLSVGSVLVLIAIGLAITFGVMGVINMAHGELMMLGAYTTYVVQTLMPGHIGISVLVAIPPRSWWRAWWAY